MTYGVRLVRDSRYAAAAFDTRSTAIISVSTNSAHPAPSAIPTHTNTSPISMFPRSVEPNHCPDCTCGAGGGE